MLNTDDADYDTVLLMTRLCAASWEPKVRLLGNVRAGDIVRAIDEVRAEVRRLRAALAEKEQQDV